MSLTRYSHPCDWLTIFLVDFESSFDGLVSSSNAVDSDEVYVGTSKPIFWNIELAFLKGK